MINNKKTEKKINLAKCTDRSTPTIVREVFDTFPPTVQYSITEHGMSLEKLLKELQSWGLSHRKKIIG